MQTIIGYKIGKIGYVELEDQLSLIQKSLDQIADNAYHSLLGEEIAFLCDAVTLNILHRDEQSIFEAATTNLDSNIVKAQKSDGNSPYNFTCYGHILNLDNEFILKLTLGNDRYLKAFSKYESVGINETEAGDENNAKTILWNTIQKKYDGCPVTSINLTPLPVVPDLQKVKFPDFDKRVEMMARHSVLNHYMNQLAGGGPIPPFLLMPYFDKATKMFDSPVGKYDFEKRKKELTGLLIELRRDSPFIRT